MEKIVILILSFVLLFSCKSDDDALRSTDIVGKWQLVEQLLDPGDGSGTFQSVDSELALEFFDDGTIVSRNGSLCNIFTESGGTSSGTFSLNDNMINIECPSDTFRISFERTGLNLVLNFSCIEACAQKYKKVS